MHGGQLNNYNVYCDESCWLQFDKTNVIAWGAIYCPSNLVYEIHKDIKTIKTKYNLNKNLEVKWNKVSIGRGDFYLELIDYFFSNSNLYYRGLIVPDKSILDHSSFNQDHNEWYYKMYFELLKNIIDQNTKGETSFKIYFDVKDKWQAVRLQYLSSVLKNYFKNTSEKINLKMQSVSSNEVGLIQLADLITGAITYVNRNLNDNKGKVSVINKIKFHSGLTLNRTTPVNNKKFNLLVWHPK